MTTKKTAIEYNLSAKFSDFERVKIQTSADAAKYISNFYSDDIHIYESVFILLLNRQNDTIGYAKISQGGISGTVVDIRIILKYAIETLASGVIMAHNHPSGQLKASPQDTQISKKLKEAMQYMDISLLDSLIITADNYYSMADDGII
jgi:DNA repair protein RadC